MRTNLFSSSAHCLLLLQKYLSKKCRELSVPKFMEVQMTSLQSSYRNWVIEAEPSNDDDETDVGVDEAVVAEAYDR